MSEATKIRASRASAVVIVDVDASNREQVVEMMRARARNRVERIAGQLRSAGKAELLPGRLRTVASDVLWRLGLFGASRNSGGMDFNTLEQTDAFLKHLVSFGWTKDELYGARSALHLAYGPWPWVAAEDQVLPENWLNDG